VPHSTNDPDNEVSEWRWVDCFNGVPADIAGNLAHPKNVVLERIGLTGQAASATPVQEG
jgi:hypothetical protein